MVQLRFREIAPQQLGILQLAGLQLGTWQLGLELARDQLGTREEVQKSLETVGRQWK